MDIYTLIRYTSMIVWSLTPIRQYGSKYFYYFLILALTDPIVTFSNYLGIYSLAIFLFAEILLLISLIDIKFSKLNSALLFILSSIFVIIIANLSFEYYFIASMIIHFAIIVIILKIAIIYIFDKWEINIFHIVFILYESLMITRSISILVELKTGTVFFFITTVFQLLIAIFFIVIREDKPKLAIKLMEKSSEF